MVSCDGATGRAATTPEIPISETGSSRANRISCSRPAPADAGELDLDVRGRAEPGQADDALGEIDDLHRLAHVEHVDGDVGA